MVAAVRWLAAALALPPLLALAIVARVHPRARRAVVWGPTPLISLKYWSAALRQRGWQSRTVVHAPYGINTSDDFDRLVSSFPPHGPLRVLRPYVVLGWSLERFDVFCFFLDGGFLSATPAARLELPLLRLAGKRVVVTPYGADVAVRGSLGPFERPIFDAYPALAAKSDETRRRVDHVCRWADLVVANLQSGYLPRRDVEWPTQFAVDTERWAPSTRPQRDEVVVVHSSNHRAIKGTDALIVAVDALRAEGLPVRLELLESVPNERVREGVLGADVVVEQLIGGYAMAAVEALSAGKPVLSNLSWLPRDYCEQHLADCPIVDADVDTVRDRLRELVLDEARRTELGRRGREFALAHHSLAAVGARWEELFASVR